jgi:hypothetical protein
MYVQPRARGALLPLSLPEASVLGGRAELRGDWDLGCCDRRHREFAGIGGDQGHRRVTRQVFSSSISVSKTFGSGGIYFLFFSLLRKLADEQPTLLIYAALGVPPFRSIKLRKRRATCLACGTEGEKVGKIEDMDYVQFCGGPRPDWETLGLNPSSDTASRITANVGFVLFSRVQSSRPLVMGRRKADDHDHIVLWRMMMMFAGAQGHHRIEEAG